MPVSSRPVSSQQGVHPRLAEIVGRHLASPWRRPVRAYSQPAFARAAGILAGDRPLILDSGCGTGVSTARLAVANPACVVLGIDRSAARLARQPVLPPNACLVRADLADFWRLADAAAWRLQKHYLLYPNPWPKPAQIKRRWHAHPVWPALLALGGRLEMRTNFPMYAEEFAVALNLAGYTATPEPWSPLPQQALSLFERKYVHSGHPLFRVCVDLYKGGRSA